VVVICPERALREKGSQNETGTLVLHEGDRQGYISLVAIES